MAKPVAIPKRIQRISPGDTATIIEGPFMCLQATIVDCVGLHEAKVLIEAFGREVQATLRSASLRAA